MTKLLALLLACPVLLLGTAYTGSVTGDWKTAATWGSAGVPTAGDTVTINAGITVTVSDTRIVGTWGPSGTIVCDLGTGGILSIAAGGFLTVRGDITSAGSAGGAPGPTQLTMAGGSILEFDASGAANASLQHYKFDASTNFNYNFIAFNGTSGNHVTVRSNSNGGAAFFFTASGMRCSTIATYTDFLRIGDANNPGWNLQITDTASVWNVTNSTFTNSGAINQPYCGGGCGMDAGTVFIHDYNVHTGTLGGQIFSGFGTFVAKTTGTRELIGNVFDAILTSGSFFYTLDHTIRDNYFGGGYSASGGGAATSPWALWTRNFVRFTSNGMGNACGAMSDSYIFQDVLAVNNPHVITECGPVPAFTYSGLIWGHAGDANTDSGEFVFLGNPASLGTYLLKNSIGLPNMFANSSAELASVIYPNLIGQAEHNTWWTGTTSASMNNNMINGGESTGDHTGAYTSIRSNVAWNAGGNAYQPWQKFHAFTATNNLISPATAGDYNTGFGVGYTPAGNVGYGGTFSGGAPGAHDVDANPNFYDYQRNVELYDSKGLGNHPAAWASGASRLVGDFVSYSLAGVYWGLPINYRYINTGTCASSLTTPPGMQTTQSSDCWEWATLYRMRQDIGTKGASSTFINTMIQWVRAGYAPMNPSLWGAGHDGQDIGAVQHSAMGATAVKGMGGVGTVK